MGSLDIQSNAKPLNHNGDDSKLRPFPFSPISGECVQYVGKTLEGYIALSNYRIVLSHSENTFCIPLGVIEDTECRKVVYLTILCKDTKSYKCSFSSNEVCLDWQRRIADVLIIPSNVEKVFAYAFYHSTGVQIPELHNLLINQADGSSSYISRSKKIFEDEVKRLGFDMGGAWKISEANQNYELCSSYPRKIIVPSSISDNSLEVAASFRSSRRIPAVVWRHSNGAVIARCSQPEVGWLWWRSDDDEKLVTALAEACAFDCPATNDSTTHQLCENYSQIMENSNVWKGSLDKHYSISLSSLPSMCNLPNAKSPKDIKKVLIMDARSYATAVANRARGGGFECPEYYPTSEIQFMNLDNIHTIRKSHHALRNLMSLPSNIPNWLTLLDNTRWLSHIANLIKASVTVAQTIAVDARPVLVHCSDGWDRTPQITALAEILLDPFYRTMEGFQILIEREWIEFGHKFSDRCGCGVGSEDTNERCPVFLQWFDCVHQVVNQYSVAFQFNQEYLVKLAQHIYSNLFGTFLFNSSQERYINEQQKGYTYTVWALFKYHQHRYINHLYSPTNKVLYPSFDAKDLVLWNAMYISRTEKVHRESTSKVHIPFSEKGEDVHNDSDLVKTKSCENLYKLSSTQSFQIVRRSSDPNLRESFPDMALLKSALGSDALDDDCKHGYNDRNSIQTSENGFHQTLSNGTVEPRTHSTLHHSPQTAMNKSSLGNSKTAISPCYSNKTESFRNDCNGEIIKGMDICFKNKVRDLAKRSIEGSTDTLVSETGVCNDDQPHNDKPGLLIQDNTFNSTALGKEKQYTNGNKVLDEGFSAIRTSKFAHRPCQVCHHDTTLSSEEKTNKENFNHCSNIASSIYTCSVCVHSKKLSQDINEVDTWKTSDMQENITTSNGVINGVCGTKKQFLNTYLSPTASTEEKHHGYQGKLYQTIDGLPNFRDDVTRRLDQINYQHQCEVDNLKRELQVVRSLYHQLAHTKFSPNNDHHTEDQISLPESVGSGSGGSLGQESGLSDNSWEALDEGDTRPTLWVPDHAVDHCMGCQSQFWIGRRKHHCRSCGKIFCAECSENSVPIPNENLYDPVRVCENCYLRFDQNVCH